jgi:hypothetical protein
MKALPKRISNIRAAFFFEALSTLRPEPIHKGEGGDGGKHVEVLEFHA